MRFHPTAAYLEMGVIDKLRRSDATLKLVKNVTADNDEEPDEDSLRHVANYTYDENEVSKVMDLLCLRLNDKGSHWRRVEKSLVLLYYLVQFGSLRVVEWYGENTLLVQALSGYHQQEHGQDIAGNIRKYASQIVQLMRNKPGLEQVRNECANKLQADNKREVIMRRIAKQKELQENYTDLVRSGARMNYF